MSHKAEGFNLKADQKCRPASHAMQHTFKNLYIISEINLIMDLLLDGSDAGGQFVRTAVALAAITGKPIKITNIRGARPEPGLKTQHIEGIRAIASLCNAEIEGLEVGSRTLTFLPGRLEAKDIEINISTAGSIGLVLQALLLVTANLDKSIKIKIRGGGTWNKWAPPVCYFNHVFLPLIKEDSEIKILKEGFYPRGGAEVEVLTKSWTTQEINITDAGCIDDVEIFSFASQDLQRRNVAERQAEAAVKYIKEKLKIEAKINASYSQTDSTGTGILIVCRTENSIFGADALGELGQPAERVGATAAKYLVQDLFSGAVDIHAADMLLPYIAFHGSGKIFIPSLTHHVVKNIEVLEKFFDKKFKIEERGRGVLVEL
jgi:RNA 3'-terminal phosphate cyclase (ATP)/RNA 3'-terminal phosphate cyclase (GTP)